MTHQTEKTTPEKGAIMNNTPDAKNTMRAIVQDRYGSADVLRLAEIRRPEIADDEVLVHVRAAALDRGTWHLMTGQPYLMRRHCCVKASHEVSTGRSAV